MIISYRGSFFSFAIVLSCQAISYDHSADLLHLIRLGVPASRLKVEDLLDSVLREVVLAGTADALSNADSKERKAEIAMVSFAFIARSRSPLKRCRSDAAISLIR
jgi:hypothetical protein